MNIHHKRESKAKIGSAEEYAFVVLPNKMCYYNDAEKLHIAINDCNDNHLCTLQEEQIRDLVRILTYYLDNREIESYKEEKIVENEPNRL